MPAADAITRPLTMPTRDRPTDHRRALADVLLGHATRPGPDDVLAAVEQMTDAQRARLAARLGVPAAHPLFFLPGPGPDGWLPPRRDPGGIAAAW